MAENATLSSLTGPTMMFLGVTTGQSLSRRLFPLWTAELGLSGAQLVGVDLPPRAPAAAYRRLVEQIGANPLLRGALITLHKIDLLDASRDLFDRLDEYATLCREVSCITKRDEQLLGHAFDPITAGEAVEAVVGPGYWERTSADLLCLGAGGAGVALTTHLMARAEPQDRPARLWLVDRSSARLQHMRQLLARLPATSMGIELVLNSDPRRNDRIMAGLVPGSLVINATGLGKDLPGSPITDEGLFPPQGIAWDLNYRGERPFLRQAARQAETQGVSIHDGWHYFLIGWIMIIGAVFERAISPAEFERLVALAGPYRQG